MKSKAYQNPERRKWYAVKSIPKAGKAKMVCSQKHTKSGKVVNGMQIKAYQNPESQKWYENKSIPKSKKAKMV